MIKGAEQYPVHILLSHDGRAVYRIPHYQREYSWTKMQWEELFADLIEAEGAHFLGTIITLDQTRDALQENVLSVIDGQQRLTTLSLILAAVLAVLAEHREELDEDARADLLNLGRMLVSKAHGTPRISLQTQGTNNLDYVTVLAVAGLPIEGDRQPYFSARRISKCFVFFRDAIQRLAETENLTEVAAAERVRDAVLRAVLVKIEVESSADAFVLFESLNNRGLPLSPVDLIKTQLLAESEKKGVSAEDAFARWNEMLTRLGDSSAIHERFLRHFYNAFRTELPEVANASVATRSNLIRIYETLLARDLEHVVPALVEAAGIYGRINGVAPIDQPTALDRAFQRLQRAQGAPSYVLLLWLMSRQRELDLSEAHLRAVTEILTSFFVRRNLTGYPQTHGLARLFMGMIEDLRDARGAEVPAIVAERLREASSSDEEFRSRLTGRIYDENSDVTRFILTALAEDAMTKETEVDLWRQEKDRFVWTIEHILPQGENLPPAWQEMLGGEAAAARVQEEHRHRLGNLTITAYNSNLGNKSFVEKRDRRDASGRPIGYRNNLSLNADLAGRSTWTEADIERRTQELAARVIAFFPLR